MARIFKNVNDLNWESMKMCPHMGVLKLHQKGELSLPLANVHCGQGEGLLLLLHTDSVLTEACSAR